MKEFVVSNFLLNFNIVQLNISKTRNSFLKSIFVLIVFLQSQFVISQKLYQEKEGLVLMEAENTLSTLDLWNKETSFEGFSGKGYIEFTANQPDGKGNFRSPLMYKFTITTPGDYALLIRSRSRLIPDERNDLANDGWVRVEGDYAVGAGGPPDMSWLNKDTKIFVSKGGDGKWGWATKLDINHVQPAAIYNFKAGQTYTLYLSGRSLRFNVDRILFVKTTNDVAAAKNATTESDSCDNGELIERYIYEAIHHFPTFNMGTVPYYKDDARKALAINAAKTEDRNKFAQATTTFSGNSGIYDVKLITLAETDGECTYKVLVNKKVIGTFQNPRVEKENDYQLQYTTFSKIALHKGDTICVESNTHSNGLIPEKGGFAWARGRWKSLTCTASIK